MQSRSSRWPGFAAAAGLAIFMPVTSLAEDDAAAKLDPQHDQLFGEIDRNQDDFLTWTELEHEAAKDIRQSELNLRSYDSDRDERLSKDEFVLLIVDVESAQQTASREQEEDESTVLREESEGKIVVESQPAKVKVQQAEAQVEVMQQEPQVRVEQQEPQVQVEDTAPQIRVEQKAPKVVVEQPRPTVRVEVPKPEVTVSDEQPNVQVSQEKPDVQVSVPEPQVEVRQPKPDVQVEQPEPRVRVEADKPEIVMERAEPEVSVDEGKAQVDVTRAEPQVDVNAADPKVEVEQREAQVSVQKEGDPSVRVERPEEISTQVKEQKPQTVDSRSPIYRLDLDTVEGQDVFNARGQQVGEIENVVLRKSDGKAFAVIHVGGFLGLSEEKASVSLDELSIQGDKIVWGTAAEEDQLEDLAAYEERNYVELKVANDQETIGEAMTRMIEAE